MSEKMTQKEMINYEMINYIDVLEEQNGRVIKEKEELIKQLKVKPPLSPETIEVIRLELENIGEDYYLPDFSDEVIQQAQAEFNKVYGGEE